ncbi:ABC transporter substrate-binding protein [Nonomuraea pusilla]|uniref:ABC transporter substrate-binding protein n=1 Tax=Nonomuraea pusilla TaxID=46177 RepID=UPI00332121AF
MASAKSATGSAARRTLAAVAAGALAVAMTAGCGGGGETGSGDGKQLTIWSSWLKGQPGQRFLQGVADDFQARTGIKVTIEWKGNAAAKALLPALNSTEMPTDIIESTGGAITNALAPTGGLLDIADVYQMKIPGTDQTVQQAVGDQAMSLSTPVDGTGARSGGPVQVPYWASSSNVVFYNGKRFPELVSAPPQDWDQFMAVLDAQKAKGRKPLALDGSIQSYSALYYTSFLSSIMGVDALAKASLDKSGRTWGSDPGYLQAAEMVEKLARGGYFIDGYSASKFPAMENKWANDEADFNVNGTWLPGEVGKVAAAGFDFRAFPFPAVKGKKAPPLPVAVNGLAILKKAKNAEAAKQFAAFLLQRSYQEQVSTQLQDIPVMKGVPAPGPLQAVKDVFDRGEINTFRFPTGLADYLTKVFYELDDQLVFGKISAKEFVDKMVSQTAAYWRSKN